MLIPAFRVKQELPEFTSHGLTAKERTLMNLLALSKRHNAHKHHFVPCGSGHFSQVFTHPSTPGVVYKLATAPSGRRFNHNGEVRPQDDGYDLYAQWCLEYLQSGGTDKTCPPIKARRRVNSETYVYVIGCLNDRPAEDIHGRQHGKATDSLYGYIINHRQHYGNTRFLNYIKRRAKQVRGIRWDIHGGNVMWTDDEHMVLTDPISYLLKGKDYDDVGAEGKSERASKVKSAFTKLRERPEAKTKPLAYLVNNNHPAAVQPAKLQGVWWFAADMDNLEQRIMNGLIQKQEAGQSVAEQAPIKRKPTPFFRAFEARRVPKVIRL